MTTTTAQNHPYQVHFYDHDDDQWFVLGDLHLSQADAWALFESYRNQDRVRVQKWNGTDWVTTRDSNTEA